MMLIPDAQTDRAAYVIDRSQIAETLTGAIELNPQGRRRQLPLRTYLIGAYLSIEERGSFKNTAIYEVLTVGLSHPKQYELGVRFIDRDGTVTTIGKSKLDYLSRTLPRHLAYTPNAAARWDLDIDQVEMERRRDLLQRAINDLLGASIATDGGSWYALDGSGAWSWGRAKQTINDDTDIRTLEDAPTDRVPDTTFDDPATDEDDDDVDGFVNQVLDDDAAQTSRRKPATSHDPDAAIGSKTSKAGRRESYYGYVLDAAIRITPPGETKQPVVLERMVVSPASTDVVAPSLTMLDSLAATGTGVSDIVVDRHYSYKRVDRWADELRKRQIEQHFDLRSDEQGFKDINGMRLVAGWMHCPATPDRLADIPRPGFNASRSDRDEFTKRITERETWALDRHERVNDTGRSRWMCPAIAGKLGCPLREGTVDTAESAGLPIVSDPPDPATAPSCCTNASGIVSDRSDATRKHQQPYYWGTEQWQQAYDLRTYVEGLFGSLKNPDTEDVRRGFTKFVGLPMMSLGLALAAAVCNVRHQRNFWTNTPDQPDHPLLTPDPDFNGWRELTQEECDQADQEHVDTAERLAA